MITIPFCVHRGWAMTRGLLCPRGSNLWLHFNAARLIQRGNLHRVIIEELRGNPLGFDAMFEGQHHGIVLIFEGDGLGLRFRLTNFEYSDYHRQHDPAVRDFYQRVTLHGRVAPRD